MYQTIDEPVAVVGIYTQGHFQPKKFQWRQKTFKIEEVTSVHNFKDGTVAKRRFAVMAHRQLFLLEFNRSLETWSLAQLWVEG